MILNPKETLARDLFFQTGKTQKEIAQIIGVSEKTIYLWMKDGDWKRLRSASRLMPSMIVENFYAQVQELNDDIRSRGTGRRYPTVQEAEVFRKMVMTISRIQKGHTQPEYMEMMQKFLSWLMSQDAGLGQALTPIADKFLKSRSVDGFHPFDIEYEPQLPQQEPDELHISKVSHFFSKQEEIPPSKEDLPQTTNVVSEQGDVGLSPAPQPGQEPATTGNCTKTPYDNPHNASGETPSQKPEISLEHKTGNEPHNTSSPPERPAEVSPTYTAPDGTIKPLPEYMSKEYLQMPLYLRERLYTIIGTPKTGFTNGNANF